jgi:hypothetical protein
MSKKFPKFIIFKTRKHQKHYFRNYFQDESELPIPLEFLNKKPFHHIFFNKQSNRSELPALTVPVNGNPTCLINT